MYSTESILNYTIFTESLLIALLNSGTLAVFAVSGTLPDLFRPRVADRYRINPEYKPALKIIKKYAEYLLRYALIQTVLAVLLWPLFRGFFRTEGIPSVQEVLLSLLIYTAADDFIFYWVHRILHIGWFYRKIHSLHHRAKETTALSAVYFHPAELLLITISALAGPLLAGGHIAAFLLWIIIRQTVAAEGHSGFRIPAFYRIIPMYAGAVFHYRHHKENDGNYGLFFRFWDWLFGTLSPVIKPVN